MLPDPSARAEGRAPLPFLIFLAMMTSVIALTIDAILPALDTISADLGFADPADRHLLVLAVFAGMGLGQPVFGPLSDAIGRRPAASIGWALYAVGTVVAMVAGDLWWVVAGRVLQGVGAAGPRVVATAIVRDLYEGRAMARIVSLIMTVFMLVPMFAPLIGQGLEALAGWRAIFGLYLAMAFACAVWHLYLPETLPPAARRPLRIGPIARAFAEALTTRSTMLYTAGSSMIFAAFAAFLAAAQQIYEEIFGLGELFPLVFALMALVFAAAQFANSRLVMTLGMRLLCRIAAVAVVVAGLAAIAADAGLAGRMPLWLFLVLLSPIFAGAALLFSNLTALALEPLGHIAGTASAVVMSVSTLAAVPLGRLVAEQIHDTPLPLFAGFAVFGALTLAAVIAADRMPGVRRA
jgi:DHA1 family bicyclomycin/chloramphenicol resistance-like MFS transporter